MKAAVVVRMSRTHLNGEYIMVNKLGYAKGSICGR